MENDKSRLSTVRRIGPVAIGLVFGLALFSQIAFAAEPATQPSAPQTQPAGHTDSIKRSFADLANSDPAVRSEALTQLMGLSADDLPTLKKIVHECGPLAPAQASVLRQIVTQAYLAGEDYHGDPAVGFLGVRMEPSTVVFHDVVTGAATASKPGVVIVERMPGFTGARMLRDGDLILTIVDRPDTPLQDSAEFALAVRQFKAGDMIHFQVLRQGEVIVVSVKLDPRPTEADPNFGITDLLDARRKRADEYWVTDFAPLVNESFS